MTQNEVMGDTAIAYPSRLPEVDLATANSGGFLYCERWTQR